MVPAAVFRPPSYAARDLVAPRNFISIRCVGYVTKYGHERGARVKLPLFSATRCSRDALNVFSMRASWIDGVKEGTTNGLSATGCQLARRERPEGTRAAVPGDCVPSIYAHSGSGRRTPLS